MVYFSIEKWHIDGDPRRGFEQYHGFFHDIGVLKIMFWSIELYWVVVILAFKVYKFTMQFHF